MAQPQSVSRFGTDLLRVLASCYIVFNHVSWPVFMQMGTSQEGYYPWVTALANQFGKPSVLFFIFLSGFAFSGLAGERYLSTGRFYINRVARILPPFLLVTLLAFVLRHGHVDPVAILSSLPLGTGMFHLYFVPLICYLYLLFPLLRKIPPTVRNVTLVFSLALIAYLLLQWTLRIDANATISTLCGTARTVCDFARVESGDVRSGLFTWARYFIFALPFFQAGIWLGRPESRATLDRLRMKYPRRKLILFVLPLTLLAYAGVVTGFLQNVRGGADADSSGIIWRVSVSLYALACILTVSLLLRRGYDPVLSWLARCSFLVYLIHPFFIPLFRPWYPLHAVWPILALSWATAAVLQWIALRSKAIGFFLGEGDRLFAPLAGTPRTQTPPSNIP